MSDLDVCQYIDDYAEVCTSTTRTARVERVCCECGGRIPPGAVYEHCKMLYDGQWDTYSTCPACLRGPVAFVSRNCPGGRMYEGLFEHLGEVLYDRHLRTPFAEGLVMRWIDEANRRRADARSRGDA